MRNKDSVANVKNNSLFESPNKEEGKSRNRQEHQSSLLAEQALKWAADPSAVQAVKSTRRERQNPQETARMRETQVYVGNNTKRSDNTGWKAQTLNSWAKEPHPHTHIMFDCVNKQLLMCC